MKKLFVILIVALITGFSVNTHAQDAIQDFILVNETGVVIYNIYISPSDVNDWEEDVLGPDVFMDGDETTIQFHPMEDACLWDLKVTDKEGNAIIWYDIDLCKWYVITLHWDGEKATATFEE